MEKQVKKIIRTIYHKDVNSTFNQLGLNAEFNKGEILCNRCSSIITEQNFRGVYKCDGKLKFICDKPQCFDLHCTDDKKMNGGEQ
jgi:hypothetical protein